MNFGLKEGRKLEFNLRLDDPNTIHQNYGSDGEQTIATSSFLGNGVKLFFKGKLIEDLEVPDGVKVIGNSFAEYSYLKSVKIPKSVESCHVEAFAATKNYKRLYVPGIEYLFKACTGAITWTDEIYADGELISDLVYPEDVKEIGKYSFLGYKGLKSVTFPDELKVIPDLSFYSCPNLKEINFGNNLKVISVGCFAHTDTYSVTFPASLETLKNLCFFNWGKTKSPKTIVCLGSEPAEFWPLDYYYDVYFGANTTVYIPNGSLKAYTRSGIQPWDRRRVSDDTLIYTFIIYKPGEASVDNIENDIADKYRICNGRLTFSTDVGNVMIYSIDGRQIYVGGPTEIELSHGCYILSIDGKSVKFMI